MYIYFIIIYTFIMNKNCIDCDVANCMFNKLGKECTLSAVKITKDFTDLTCCGSFKQKDVD